MKLIVYDGEKSKEARIRNFYTKNGEDIELITDDDTIKSCIGCFGCWVKTPGRCVIQDNYNRMGEKMAHAKELIIISRCVYGTYSPFVKNVLDRSLSYIHPDFTKREHEIHHKPRYKKKLPFRVYFYGACTEAEQKTAQKTVKANVLNFNGILKEVVFKDSEEDIWREDGAN